MTHEFVKLLDMQGSKVKNKVVFLMSNEKWCRSICENINGCQVTLTRSGKTLI